VRRLDQYQLKSAGAVRHAQGLSSECDHAPFPSGLQLASICLISLTERLSPVCLIRLNPGPADGPGSSLDLHLAINSTGMGRLRRREVPTKAAHEPSRDRRKDPQAGRHPLSTPRRHECLTRRKPIRPFACASSSWDFAPPS
jgi:hypothetical protein